MENMGWIGDDVGDLAPHLFADADLAGCPVTERSTSGYFLAIRGPNSCFPIAYGCKRQGACAHSTAEAEVTSMDYALRHCGLPSLCVWELLLPNFIAIYCHEDNQAMIRLCLSGNNPTLRYLSRTMGVSVAWLHERFKEKYLCLSYEESEKMAADIFTKVFTDPEKWKHACRLVNIVDPDEFLEILAQNSTPSPAGGGI